jgi:hypothetical protein
VFFDLSSSKSSQVYEVDCLLHPFDIHSSLGIMDTEARAVQYAAAQIRHRIREEFEEDALQLGPRKKPYVCHRIFIARACAQA